MTFKPGDKIKVADLHGKQEAGTFVRYDKIDGLDGCVVSIPHTYPDGRHIVQQFFCSESQIELQEEVINYGLPYTSDELAKIRDAGRKHLTSEEKTLLARASLKILNRHQVTPEEDAMLDYAWFIYLDSINQPLVIKSK